MVSYLEHGDNNYVSICSGLAAILVFNVRFQPISRHISETVGPP